MSTSRRDFFRLGSRDLLQKLAGLAGENLDRLGGPREVSAEEAGHALRTLWLKRATRSRTYVDPAVPQPSDQPIRPDPE